MSHIAALPVIFPERREIAWKIVFPEDGDVTAFLRRFHGDLTATLVFLWSSMAFLRRSTWRLLALSLRFHGNGIYILLCNAAQTTDHI